MTGFALTWQTVGGIILMLVLVVSIHEFGHFLVAKRAGIQVDEFSIGFGPRLLRWKPGETTYSLRLLPLGGYVRMAGMTGMEKPEESGGERAFIRASSGRRAAVLAAGGLMNLLLAGAIFSGIAAFGGPAPQTQRGGGMAAAGVPNGYQLVGVAGERTTSLTRIRDLIQADRGDPLQVSVQPWGGARVRSYTVIPQLHWVGQTASSKIPVEAEIVAINGQPVPHADPSTMARLFAGTAPLSVTYLARTKRVTVAVPRADFQVEWLVGYLGSAGNPLLTSLGGPPLPWYRALAVGFYAVPTQIGATFVNLWTLISPHHNPNLRLTGPVGIAYETSIATQISASVYLTLMALISLNLGLFNLLPIPFLDGGRLAFVVLEWIRRRRVNPQLEAAVHAVGLALIVMLFIYVTFGDVTHLTR
ncbi:MAG: M50 family metallopeptidase [Candidatus Dormibacteria bacterium]